MYTCRLYLYMSHVFSVLHACMYIICMYAAPAACRLDKTGDLSFFQQQDMIVCCLYISMTYYVLNMLYSLYVSCQGRKRGKRRAKAAAAAQQKTVGERKPVASDRTVKDVCATEVKHSLYIDLFCFQILGELYVDREYLSNLIKDPGMMIHCTCINY